MSTEQFDPKWVDDCPRCAAHAKELEAASGLRCTGCLESFDKPYRQPSESDPSMCDSCFRVAEYRATAPKSVGRYGTRGDQ